VNYLCHAHLWLDRPWFAAGTATPDWLGAVDRPARVRSRRACEFVYDPDERMAQFARGIVQHHHDDDWFHATPRFAQIQFDIGAELKKVLPDDRSFRPSFAVHVLVELLLDAVLAEKRPGLLDRYYAAIRTVDAGEVEAFVNRMAPNPTQVLGGWIGRFVEEGFLYDYLDDPGLFRRLNHVLLRVRSTPLPEEALPTLAFAREQVRLHQGELLAHLRDREAYGERCGLDR
jgi:hypothetical protein